MKEIFNRFPPAFLEVWAIFKNGKKTKAWYDSTNQRWMPSKQKDESSWAPTPLSEEVIGWSEIHSNSLKRQIERAREYHKAKNECNENEDVL